MKIENTNQPRGLNEPKETPENPELKKVAKQFEAVFINQMIGAMRKTVTPGGLIPESNAERVFKGMLDSEHAERMADAEQLGLSKIIYEHLLRTSQGK
ncbi:MAG: flagellar biosynthesis protein FlgJ [Proteobacteria bacterium]|nr:flagellar biosynthesis protein FlgJ [Pseudomonadota bacterium]